MLSYKAKYIISLAVLNCLLAVLSVLYLKVIFDDIRSIIGVTVLLALFFAYELFVILYTESKIENITSRQTVNLFLLFKAGKLILSLSFIAIYATLINAETINFICVFLAIYFIYLFFDTIYLINREKSLKKKQYKLKEIEKISNYYK